jgi:hypothetical protein
MMHTLQVMIGAALLMLCGAAWSASLSITKPIPGAGGEPALANMSAEQFLAFHDELGAAIAAGKYHHLTARERRAIERAQAEIRRRLAAARSVEALDQAGRLAVFDAHERVVAVLNDAEAERVICEKRHRVGSHRPIIECTTVAERERVHRETQRTLRLEATDTSTY